MLSLMFLIYLEINFNAMTMRTVTKKLPFLLYFLIMVFLGLVFIYPYEALTDPNFDTLPITNYGFAVMAGCASVCFSWAKSYDSSTKTGYIKFSALCCFFSAILFIIASIIKYSWLQSDSEILGWDVYVIYFNILHYLANIIFLISIACGILALSMIFLSLYIIMKYTFWPGEEEETD